MLTYSSFCTTRSIELRTLVAHPRRYLLSSSWPSLDIVYTLVKKTSGQFIYASTVTKFVASIRHQPADRLDIILGLRAPRNELPFAELDALYMHIP